MLCLFMLAVIHLYFHKYIKQIGQMKLLNDSLHLLKIALNRLHGRIVGAVGYVHRYWAPIWFNLGPLVRGLILPRF